MFTLRFCLSALMLALQATALPSNKAIQARLVEPDQDPFYNPPAGFESATPGAILKQRTIKPALVAGLIPETVQAFQLLYRTTAVNGSAIASVTTVFKPLLHQKDRFVAFHIAYDTVDVNCAASYSFQLGSGTLGEVTTLGEQFVLEAYLIQGYIVSASDYEGPDAAFAVGRLQGMVALDAMRATSNFKDLQFSNNSPAVVSVGYSGGSVGSMWAAALHQTYAPEVNVKGWVGGGVPANLTAVVDFVDGSTFAGFPPQAIAALNKPSAYQAQLQPLLDKILGPQGKKTLAFVQSHCVAGSILSFVGQSIYDYQFQTLGKGLLYESTVAKILTANTLGLDKQLTPTVPVLIYHGEKDELVPYKNVKQLQTDWCSHGASVKLVTLEHGGHITTEGFGLLEAIPFVIDAFAGNLKDGCSNVSRFRNSLDPLALGIDLEPVLLGLLDVLFGKTKP